MPDSDPQSPGAPRRDGASADSPAQQSGREGEGWLSRVLRAVFGWKPGSIRADLEVVLEDTAGAESGFSPEERKLLKNILDLRERRVEDVMVPRADIVAVQRDIKLGDLIKVFQSAGHSRLVVYEETLDDAIGMVHIRDLLAFMASQSAISPEVNAARETPLPAELDLTSVDLNAPLSSTSIVRTILYVPPSMPAVDLLAKMQATRIHLALVVDEYGGADGLLSMEDIVEQIVGEIEDEHDEDEMPALVRQPDGSYVADARASLEEVVATLDHDFDVGDAADEVDTLGGYLVMLAGRVPVRGELIAGPGDFEIEVLDADPRRVKRMKIYRRKDRARSRDGRRRDRKTGADSTDGGVPAEGPGLQASDASVHSDQTA